jgi:predicted HTH transcriptional regulator
MTKKDIIEILGDGERVNVEVKRAQSDVPKSIWETYSAFANTYGGTILLGVEERVGEANIQNRFTIVGVHNARKIVADFGILSIVIKSVLTYWLMTMFRLWTSMV